MPLDEEGVAQEEGESEIETESAHEDGTEPGLDVDEVGVQDCVLVNTTIRADDDVAAQAVRAVTMKLGVADLQKIFAEAIKSTPGIEDVMTGGEIELVGSIEMTEPVKRSRGRLTRMEDHLAGVSKGEFVPKREFVESDPKMIEERDAKREAAIEEHMARLQGTVTSPERSPKAKTAFEARDTKKAPRSRADWLEGMYSQAKAKAVERLVVEKRRIPERFLVTVVSAEKLENLGKKLKLDSKSHLFCTCMVAGRSNTLGQTAVIRYGVAMSSQAGQGSVAHQWQHQFEVRIAEEEVLEFTLNAQGGADSKPRCLGTAQLEASNFFSEEDLIAGDVDLKSDNRKVGASLQISVKPMRVEDAEREEAALKIQTKARQRKAQKEVKMKQDKIKRRKEEDAAAIKIQSAQRRKQAYQEAKAKEEREEQDAAATAIQASFRGKKERGVIKRNKEQDAAARKIQGMERDRQLRKREKAMQQKAAVTIQKNERARLARLKAAQMKCAREHDVLRDIALISGTDDTTSKGKKKGWNRAGNKAPTDAIDMLDYERESTTLPYGSGLDWSDVGYRMPSLASSPAKKIMKVAKEKVLPGQMKKARSELAIFKAELLRREQSFAGAWRTCLDPAWQGKLAIHEFCVACRKMGFSGRLRDIWHDLDVDGNGLISLVELDWEEARELGTFHKKLVKQFGSAENAGKFWGMHGPRRFKMDEFFDIVISNGLARTATAADRLWRMLSMVPNGTECSGFLGKLGKLKDISCAVTGRELKWLDVVASQLPHVTNDRVPPGEEAHLELGQELDLLKDDALVKVAPKFDHDRFFEQMYSDGMESVKRKKEKAEPKKVEEKTLSDPNLFKRLHGDYAKIIEKRHELGAKAIQKINFDANWGASRSAERDPEAQKRILAPRRKFAEFNFDCVAKKQDLFNLLSIDQLMYECDQNVARLQKEDPKTVDKKLLLEISGWKSLGKTRNELIDHLQRHHPPHKSAKELATTPPPEHVSRLYDNDLKKRRQVYTDNQVAQIEAENTRFKQGLECKIHKTYNEDCTICCRFKAMREGTPLQKPEGRPEGKLWENADEVNKKKKDYRETKFKELLKEGYHKGCIAGRESAPEGAVKSARIALEAVYMGLDSRWEMVSGRDKDRLISEAVETYSADAHARIKERKQKAHDSSDFQASFFRLYATGNHQTVKIERELERQQELLDDELALLSVHRDVEGNPEIYEALYTNDDRTQDIDHDPQQARRRARDRSVDRLTKTSDTDQKLKTIRDAMSSPIKEILKGGHWEPPKDKGGSVACLLFKDAEWKPSSRFEMQLRNRLDDLGSPFTMDMPCRFRRLGPNKTPGIIIELRGSASKVEEICKLKGVADHKLVVCGQHLTQVWQKDAVDDPLGELIDFMLLHYDSLEDAWAKISGHSTAPLNYEKFKKQVVRETNFTGDLRVAFHALDDGMSRVTPESFSTLKDALIYGHLPSESDLHGNFPAPTKSMVSMTEQIFKTYADLSVAFDSFNTSADSQLTSHEFVQGAVNMTWFGPAAAVFEELDVRGCGYLRPQEFARLGAPDVRPANLGGVSKLNIHGALLTTKQTVGLAVMVGLHAKPEDETPETGKKGNKGDPAPDDKKNEAEAAAKGKAKAKAKGKAKAKAKGKAKSQSVSPAKTKPNEEEPETEPTHAQTPNPMKNQESPEAPKKRTSSAKARPKSTPAKAR